MLAHDWLYGNRVTTKHDHVVERYLTLPTTFNKHSSVAVLNTLAERIVFTDDVPSLLYEMHDNRQLTYEGVLSSARLPYDCFWIEYVSNMGIEAYRQIDYVNYGVLIQRIRGNDVRMHIIVGVKYKEREVESTLAYIIEFDIWPPVYLSKKDGKLAMGFAVDYAFNRKALTRGGNEGEQAIAELGAIVNEVIFGIFLLTQPRVYVEEHITHKSSHAAKRQSAGKPPLLEYRKIRLHITKPRKLYSHRPRVIHGITDDTESEASVRHRRYHKVMGHFRHYVNTDTPHTTWIEPHYRGDPSLGVTFTERDVSR